MEKIGEGRTEREGRRGGKRKGRRVGFLTVWNTKRFVSFFLESENGPILIPWLNSNNSNKQNYINQAYFLL